MTNVITLSVNSNKINTLRLQSTIAEKRWQMYIITECMKGKYNRIKDL